MSELLGLATVDTHTQDQDEDEQGLRTANVHASANANAMKARMPLAAGMHAKLVKADFHGSIMTGSSSRLVSPVIIILIFDLFFYFNVYVYVDVDTVRKSKNAALVGASGIVVQETENTFKVVTRKDKLKGACVRVSPSPLLSPVSCLPSVSFVSIPSNFFFYSSAKARVCLCLCRSSI
jgi:ribonuclease P/MRP subunit p29-like protein